MPSAGDTIYAQDFTAPGFDRESGTYDNFSSSGYSATSTACETTAVAPTSGRVVVMMVVRWDSDNANELISSDVEVRVSSSGGTLVQSADATAGRGISDTHPTATSSAVNRTGFTYLTGLTGGTTYWYQLQHDTSGGQADISDQSILIIPLP